MKKVIKALIILMIVVLSVGGTCLIFFKNYKRKEAESASLETCINKMDKLDLSIVNYDGKFDSIEQTNENLEDSMFALSIYFIDDNFVIQNDDIISKVKAVDRAIDHAEAMLKEYKIKSEFKNAEELSYFDKDKGRNDLYNAMCNYIVEYATLINMVNSDLEYKNINRSADIKFAMIDVYTRVAMDTFGKTQTDTTNGITNLESSDNIDLINTYFCLKTSYLTNKEANPKLYSSSATSAFINSYSKCNKTLFAQKLSENVAMVAELNDKSTNEDYATYYFKNVYGIGV